MNMRDQSVAQLEIISGSSAVLHFANRHLPAAVGKSGVRNDKCEGDGATPTGLLPLRRILYRSDRLSAPNTSLPCEPIIETDGWCDDTEHSDYNQQIRLPHPANHERLWLENGLYDMVGVLGYNDNPIIPGCGSAIFLHVTSPDMTPTNGCIALKLEDLLWVLERGLKAIFIPNCHNIKK